MTKIEESRDCGNSPKNSFVQTVAIALETGEARQALGAAGAGDGAELDLGQS